jgi:single-stranded-DNA-specific exonuclease
MLAGVGVAFKLADMLLRAAINQDRAAPSITPDDLLDLVAIGTVADLAPLNHVENRLLVLRGLARLRQAKRPGIRALLDVANYPPDKVNAWTIGFIIGPRLNAAGRLSSAMLAYELLSTEDNQVAAKLARQLNELNETRQQLTRETQERARALVGLDQATDRLPPLIYAAAPDFRQGIVGLVAGRLTEEFYRPSVVVHRGESESHGSCRSIAEFNITEALDQCADMLIRHGGHAQAAGFAILNENLESFQGKLCDLAEAGLRGKDLRPRLDIDAEVNLNQLDVPLLEALTSLEPCGQDHPAPILCSHRVRVVESRTVGQDSAHLKLRLSDGATTQDAIAFRFGDLAPDLPETIDVAYRLELNEFNGTRRLQLNVQDIQAPQETAFPGDPVHQAL